MEISGQVLEAAAESMYHGNLAQQQEAANFFSTWQNSSNALITSVRFLSSTEESSDSLQFITCCVILYASDQWFKYDRDILNEIRNLMLQCTFEKKHAKIASSKLDEIIAKMAFNDWPEQWEDFIPQLQSFIINDFSENDFICQSHVFMILSNFLKLVSNSPKISLKRRALMIELFSEKVPGILQNIENQTDSESKTELSDDISVYKINSSNINDFPPFVIKSFLKFAKSLCLVIGNDIQMIVSFSTYLFVTFSENDQYSEKSLKAILSLISPSSYLTHLIPYMMKFMSSKESEESPISPAFHKFVCNFLINFLKIADSYITSEEITQEIQKLFLVSLESAPRDTFCQYFWSLWSECLDKISTNSLKSLHDLFSPFFQSIMTTFCELLPCSMESSRLISPLTASSFESMVKIDSEATISFIESQPPGISQCISIGIVQHQSFLPKIIQLVEECTSMDDINVLSSVLYMISRNISLMKTNSSLVTALQEISANYLLNCEDDLFHTSVLLSLNHVASSYPEALADSNEFIDMLFECQSSKADGTLRLQKENFSRLCRILSKIIMRTPSSVKNTYIQKLTDIAAVPLMTTDLTAISIGAQAAWAISSISICGSYLITKFLWKPLLVAMQNCAQHQEDEFSSIFSDIVAVFASSVRLAPFGMCRKVILKFINIAQQSVNENPEIATPVLDAYNLMFQCHCELIDYRDDFANIFVSRIAENPQPSFFEFFSIAGIVDEEKQIVLTSACEAIKDPNVELSKNAAHLLKTLINKQKDPEFLIEWQERIMHAIFEALFDELHKSIVQQIAKVLFAIYKQHLKRESLTQEIDKIVVEAIEAAVGDSTVTVNFAEALRNNADNKKDFLTLIHDFLIALGRFNPMEIKLFDDTLVVGSLTHDIEISFQGSEAAIKNEDEYAIDCI